jgi:hypothetical protein
VSVITKIKIAGAVLVLLLVAGLWVYAAGLKSELFQKTKQLEDSQKEVAGMVLELEANRRGLAEREAAVELLRSESAALTAKLEEVYQNDPEARAWGDGDCPDGVIACLRK